MASGVRPYGIDRDKPCKLIDAQEIAADRAACLARFPDAEPITPLGDFAVFRLGITGGRLVSGFGGAINDRTEPGHAASPRACTIAALSTGR